MELGSSRPSISVSPIIPYIALLPFPSLVQLYIGAGLPHLHTYDGAEVIYLAKHLDLSRYNWYSPDHSLDTLHFLLLQLLQLRPEALSQALTLISHHVDQLWRGEDVEHVSLHVGMSQEGAISIPPSLHRHLQHGDRPQGGGQPATLSTNIHHCVWHQGGIVHH